MEEYHDKKMFFPCGGAAGGIVAAGPVRLLPKPNAGQAVRLP
jgi:hypothetical protein